MRKIALAVLLLLVAACSDSDADGDSGSDVVVNHGGSIDPDDLQFVTIDGMECIVYRDKRDADSSTAYAYSGLTCDWRDR